MWLFCGFSACVMCLRPCRCFCFLVFHRKLEAENSIAPREVRGLMWLMRGGRGGSLYDETPVEVRLRTLEQKSKQQRPRIGTGTATAKNEQSELANCACELAHGDGAFSFLILMALSGHRRPPPSPRPIMQAHLADRASGLVFVFLS
jgi:hypothetical protein